MNGVSVGEGLYGVNLEEANDGVFVADVNDNPNLDDRGEDAGEKDEVWTGLTNWFIERMVSQNDARTPQLAAGPFAGAANRL